MEKENGGERKEKKTTNEPSRTAKDYKRSDRTKKRKKKQNKQTDKRIEWLKIWLTGKKKKTEEKDKQTDWRKNDVGDSENTNDFSWVWFLSALLRFIYKKNAFWNKKKRSLCNIFVVAPVKENGGRKYI